MEKTKEDKKLTKQEIKDWLVHNKRLLMYLDIQKEAITDNTELYSLNIDSLDLLEIIIDFEEEFNIRIKEEHLVKLKNVGEFINITISNLSDQIF
jgi:acyl carrier protein